MYQIPTASVCVCCLNEATENTLRVANTTTKEDALFVPFPTTATTTTNNNNNNEKVFFPFWRSLPGGTRWGRTRYGSQKLGSYDIHVGHAPIFRDAASVSGGAANKTATTTSVSRSLPTWRGMIPIAELTLIKDFVPWNPDGALQSVCPNPSLAGRNSARFADVVVAEAPFLFRTNVREENNNNVSDEDVLAWKISNLLTLFSRDAKVILFGVDANDTADIAHSESRQELFRKLEKRFDSRISIVRSVKYFDPAVILVAAWPLLQSRATSICCRDPTLASALFAMATPRPLSGSSSSAEAAPSSPPPLAPSSEEIFGKFPPQAISSPSYDPATAQCVAVLDRDCFQTVTSDNDEHLVNSPCLGVVIQEIFIGTRGRGGRPVVLVLEGMFRETQTVRLENSRREGTVLVESMRPLGTPENRSGRVSTQRNACAGQVVAMSLTFVPLSTQGYHQCLNSLPVGSLIVGAHCHGFAAVTVPPHIGLRQQQQSTAPPQLLHTMMMKKNRSLTDDDEDEDDNDKDEDPVPFDVQLTRRQAVQPRYVHPRMVTVELLPNHMQKTFRNFELTSSFALFTTEESHFAGIMKNATAFLQRASDQFKEIKVQLHSARANQIPCNVLFFPPSENFGPRLQLFFFEGRRLTLPRILTPAPSSNFSSSSSSPAAAVVGSRCPTGCCDGEQLVHIEFDPDNVLKGCIVARVLSHVTDGDVIEDFLCPRPPRPPPPPPSYDDDDDDDDDDALSCHLSCSHTGFGLFSPFNHDLVLKHIPEHLLLPSKLNGRKQQKHNSDDNINNSNNITQAIADAADSGVLQHYGLALRWKQNAYGWYALETRYAPFPIVALRLAAVCAVLDPEATLRSHHFTTTTTSASDRGSQHMLGELLVSPPQADGGHSSNQNLLYLSSVLENKNPVVSRSLMASIKKMLHGIIFADGLTLLQPRLSRTGGGGGGGGVSSSAPAVVRAMSEKIPSVFDACVLQLYAWRGTQITAPIHRYSVATTTEYRRELFRIARSFNLVAFIAALQQKHNENKSFASCFSGDRIAYLSDENMLLARLPLAIFFPAASSAAAAAVAVASDGGRNKEKDYARWYAWLRRLLVLEDDPQLQATLTAQQRGRSLITLAVKCWNIDLAEACLECLLRVALGDDGCAASVSSSSSCRHLIPATDFVIGHYEGAKLGKMKHAVQILSDCLSIAFPTATDANATSTSIAGTCPTFFHKLLRAAGRINLFLRIGIVSYNSRNVIVPSPPTLLDWAQVFSVREPKARKFLCEVVNRYMMGGVTSYSVAQRAALPHEAPMVDAPTSAVMVDLMKILTAFLPWFSAQLVVSFLVFGV